MCGTGCALLLDKSPDGSFVEKDANVRQAAAAAVETIDRWRTFYSGIETLFFGLSVGSVLVLIAIGLAITFGVMGVINMAHGELMMLGAYTTYTVQLAMPEHIGISILLAIPAAFIVAGLMGVLMERTIIRFLYGRPLETLLATFGVSLILQQLVRSIFSANNRSVITPDWMSGSLRINDALEITWNRLYIVIFTVLVFSVIQLVLKRTRLGLDIRAVSQNRAMAKAMGIRTEWVDAMTFGLGVGYRGRGGRRAEPVDQRGSESRTVLHHRFVHGGCFWRRRKSLGLADRRHVDGSRQPASRALGRRRAGEDFRPRCADSFHSVAAARIVPAKGPGGRRQVRILVRKATNE